MEFFFFFYYLFEYIFDFLACNQIWRAFVGRERFYFKKRGKEKLPNCLNWLEKWDLVLLESPFDQFGAANIDSALDVKIVVLEETPAVYN